MCKGRRRWRLCRNDVRLGEIQADLRGHPRHPDSERVRSPFHRRTELVLYFDQQRLPVHVRSYAGTSHRKEPNDAEVADGRKNVE